MTRLKKILIANRGEIVTRIARTLRQIGIVPVAIFVEQERGTSFLDSVDEKYSLGGGALTDTYLNQQKIIELALATGCDAIHPGYGFLSENADFARLCCEHKLIFIGPSSGVIELMGQKIKANDHVKSLGIPVLESYSGTPESLLGMAGKMEYPVLVKASAGGGGKGMHVVESANGLVEAIEATSRQAKTYFGNATVFVERYLNHPRHIEVQILGDQYGNIIHLFERECSVQRRFQKLIEEAPAVSISESLRSALCEAAVVIGKSVSYQGAGTVEFLVDKEGRYYFLEMNTRLQVEHPVTEEVTGTDLVEWQVRIAAGEPLTLRQEKISISGHAIELRLCAEDPMNGFIPSPGRVHYVHFPEWPGIRVEGSLRSGDMVQPLYDPMLLKLIAHAPSRDAAINLLETALSEMVVHGIDNNLSFLRAVLGDNDFCTNNLSTHFVNEKGSEILSTLSVAGTKSQTIALAVFLSIVFNQFADKNRQDIWNQIGYWRQWIEITLYAGDSMHNLTLVEKQAGSACVTADGVTFRADNIHVNRHSLAFTIKNKRFSFFISNYETENYQVTSSNGVTHVIKRISPLHKTLNSQSVDQAENVITKVLSPIQGKIIRVNVKVGDPVAANDVLAIIESMKMENKVLAPTAGLVKEIFLNGHEQVTRGMVMFEIG